MDPVDEFARRKAETLQLQGRAEGVRKACLKPGARLRSNRFEISVKRKTRQVRNKKRLSQAVLAAPGSWEGRESEVVTCRALTRAGDKDIVLIEWPVGWAISPTLRPETL